MGQHYSCWAIPSRPSAPQSVPCRRAVASCASTQLLMDALRPLHRCRQHAPLRAIFWQQFARLSPSKLMLVLSCRTGRRAARDQAANRTSVDVCARKRCNHCANDVVRRQFNVFAFQDNHNFRRHADQGAPDAIPLGRQGTCGGHHPPGRAGRRACAR